MSVELILWFVGCLVFLLLLFVARPYILQNHDDDELETRDEPYERDSADTPS